MGHRPPRQPNHSRTVKECSRFDPDNLEFTLATFDHRFLAGSYSALSESSAQETFPGLILTEWNADRPEARRDSPAPATPSTATPSSISNPTSRNAPAACATSTSPQWFAAPLSSERNQRMAAGSAGSFFRPAPTAIQTESAFDFLASARCFPPLPPRPRRQHPRLARHRMKQPPKAVGLETRGTADPAYWMRTYYRHARTVYRRAADYSWSSLPAPVSPSTSNSAGAALPIAGTEFFLEQGRIDLSRRRVRADSANPITDTDGILKRLRHDRQSRLLPHPGRRRSHHRGRSPSSPSTLPEGPYLWNCLREILLGPHAAHALRTMHALGILEMLIPEFHGIDASSSATAYHRYTVDEHTFLTIDNVHRLRRPVPTTNTRFGTTAVEIDRPRSASC